MARYYDVDKILKKIKEFYRVNPSGDKFMDIFCAFNENNCKQIIEEVIKELHPVDVVEVKWKAIDGYEGLYEVSTFGQVRNAKGQILKPYLKHEKYTSYKKVALWKDGKYKQFSIHRLVAQAFIPNENNLPIINHKDEDGTNNLVSNLEWCDRSYNATYGNATKRLKKSIKGWY